MVDHDLENIRLAGLNDIPAIVELAKEFHKETPYSSLRLDEKKIRQKLEKFIIEQGKDYVVLLSTDGDEIVGALVGLAYEAAFSSDRLAVELFWYVKPEHRRSSRGSDMLDAYEYWARGVDCKIVQFGLLSTSPTTMSRLYEKKGLVSVEHIYQKEL